jgi:zinc protease
MFPADGPAMTTASRAGLAPTRAVLENGAVILAKASTATPAVTIHVMLRAGSVHDPAVTPGVAHLLGRVLDRGTERFTADDLAEELDSRGVALQVRVTRHMTAVSLDCLSDDVEVILAIIGEIVQRPTFPPDQIELRRGEIVTRLKQDADNPATRVVEELFPLLYGTAHPYGWPAKGTPASVERIDRSALAAYHAARFAPDRASIALVGDIEPQRAVALASATFGGWRSAGVPDDPFPPVQARGVRDVRVISLPDKSQADVAYGFVTISRTDPAYYAWWVMNTVLGQYGIGGRIGDDVRERQGLAYYAYSSFDPHVVPGPLMIRAGVDGSHVDQTIATIDTHVRRMAAEGPTSDEVADTRRFLIGSLPRMLETNGGIAFFLQTAEHFGLGLDYDLRLPSLIAAVTRDAAHAAASTLSPDRAGIAIAGPYPPPEPS